MSKNKFTNDLKDWSVAILLAFIVLVLMAETWWHQVGRDVKRGE